MTWSDFNTNTALERDILGRALPLVATESNGAASAIIDMAKPTSVAFLSAVDHLGMDPARCIDVLGIRPLLVGTSWKIVDVLLETALDLAGIPADQANGNRWISSKREQAATVPPGPGVGDAPWSALMKSYVATIELRHSLVHRTVYTDPAGALVGKNPSGKPLRPMTASEQEAFGRATLRAAQLVTADHPDDRIAADLAWQLAWLIDLHYVPQQTVPRLDALPMLTVILVPNTAPDGSYLLDLSEVRRRSPLGSTSVADLVIQFHGRPGQELRGRMERAPTEQVSIVPDQPPSWLAS